MGRVARSVFFLSQLQTSSVKWEEMVSERNQLLYVVRPKFYSLPPWVVTELFLFTATYIFKRSVKFIL